MLTLAWPWLLLLLPLPLVITKVIKKSHTKASGGHLTLPGIATEKTARCSTVSESHISRWLIWCFIVIACSRPLWMGEQIDLPSKGRDLMVAVDLSGSMQIEDMQLNGDTVDRFTLVQAVVSDFIKRRKGDKIGLILFADHAYLQAPLTPDRRSVAQFLQEAQIGLVGKQTAIGEAVALGVKRFDQLDESNRILILLTDGANNSGAILPEQAAKIAAQRGVKIYTIGVGAEVLERRTLFGKERVNPSMDLDEKQLIQLAQTTGGNYFRARDAQELEGIYQEIDQLEPISRDHLSFRPQTELFYWPLTLAFIISFAHYLLLLPLFSQRKKRAQQKTVAHPWGDK